MLNAVRMAWKCSMLAAFLIGMMYAPDLHRWLTGALPDDTMIFHAVTNDDVEVFTSVATPQTTNARDALGYTPLCYAAKAGNAAWIERLIRHGARIDDAAREGFTPLMYAARDNHTAACRILLEAGADADIRTKRSGLTAAEIARENGAWDCAELLLHSLNNR